MEQWPNQKNFHPENKLANRLEEIAEMKKEAGYAIYDLHESIEQNRRSGTVSRDITIRELEETLDRAIKQWKDLQDEEDRIKKEIAAEANILESIEKQFN